ncbi:MAG: hypothetical protein WBC07_08505 [Methylotenera sp.]
MMITVKLKQDIWIGGVKQLAETNISVEESFAASLISENKAYVPAGWNEWPDGGGSGTSLALLTHQQVT